MEVNQFLSNLTNLEKTRNFNVFKNYSLQDFQSVLESFCLHEKPKDTIRISIVGTNGKGSVGHFLTQIGFRSNSFLNVGLYTSPHLLTQNERIQINGKYISDEWMNQTLNFFSEKELEKLKSLSYFEFFTFLAILFFKDNTCNLEVYEAGLGGRLDATKLVNPDIVVLTKIALDHTVILGDTEEKILLEKLEIVGTNTKTIFTFQQEKNLMGLTKLFCKEKNIELILFPRFVDKDYLSFNQDFSLFVINSILLKQKRQTLNESILSIIPPIKGRMQVLQTNPLILFDIGHNPSAVQFLLHSINRCYPQEKKWKVFFGCQKDKDAKQILETLINNELVETVYQISSENWNQESLPNSKIEKISEERFSELLKNVKVTSLILGSFKLYSLVNAIGQ